MVPAGESYCPLVHAAIELIGRRWVGVILIAVEDGADRFSDIRDAVPGLSDRLLAQRLRELEKESIIDRIGEGRDVRYSVTEKGMALFPVFQAISVFVQEWVVGTRTDRVTVSDPASSDPANSAPASSAPTASVSIR